MRMAYGNTYHNEIRHFDTTTFQWRLYAFIWHRKRGIYLLFKLNTYIYYVSLRRKTKFDFSAVYRNHILYRCDWKICKTSRKCLSLGWHSRWHVTLKEILKEKKILILHLCEYSVIASQVSNYGLEFFMVSRILYF